MRGLTRTAIRVAAAAAMVQIGPAPAALPGVSAALTRRLTRRDGRTRVALTFDDGPHPEGTPAVLDILADHDVRATFFVVAREAARHPEILARMVAAGHEVGVHGFDHRFALFRTPASARAAITRAVAVTTDLTGRPPRWYRPAYGIAGVPELLAVHRLGLRPVWWTRWARDWTSNRSPEDIARHLLGRPGTRRAVDRTDVLLLHDSDAFARPGSWRTTAAALPAVLAGLKQRGLPVGPLGTGRT